MVDSGLVKRVIELKDAFPCNSKRAFLYARDRSTYNKIIEEVCQTSKSTISMNETSNLLEVFRQYLKRRLDVKVLLAVYDGSLHQGDLMYGIETAWIFPNILIPQRESLYDELRLFKTRDKSGEAEEVRNLPRSEINYDLFLAQFLKDREKYETEVQTFLGKKLARSRAVSDTVSHLEKIRAPLFYSDSGIEHSIEDFPVESYLNREIVEMMKSRARMSEEGRRRFFPNDSPKEVEFSSDVSSLWETEYFANNAPCEELFEFYLEDDDLYTRFKRERVLYKIENERAVVESFLVKCWVAEATIDHDFENVAYENIIASLKRNLNVNQDALAKHQRFAAGIEPGRVIFTDDEVDGFHIRIEQFKFLIRGLANNRRWAIHIIDQYKRNLPLINA